MNPAFQVRTYQVSWILLLLLPVNLINLILMLGQGPGRAVKQVYIGAIALVAVAMIVWTILWLRGRKKRLQVVLDERYIRIADLAFDHNDIRELVLQRYVFQIRLKRKRLGYMYMFDKEQGDEIAGLLESYARGKNIPISKHWF